MGIANSGMGGRTTSSGKKPIFSSGRRYNFRLWFLNILPAAKQAERQKKFHELKG